MSAQPDLHSPQPTVEVARVPWPSGQGERERLAMAGLPRVLVVASDGAPPAVADELEDWIREPVDVLELAVRCETLRARARARADEPRLEADGVLRHGGRWVAVSPAQTALVEVLVRRLGEVVGIRDLREAHVGAGGVDDALAVAACLRRVALTLAEVGLDLHRLRDRGYLLERCGSSPEAAARRPASPPSPAHAARRSSLIVPGRAAVRRASWPRARDTPVSR